MRGYEVVAVLIGLGLTASWPGWYREPTWNQTMTNVFATFVVTPVLIFGVDRALARARQLREQPRHKAIRSELGQALSTAVNLGTTGTIADLLPGLIDEVWDLMNTTNSVDAASEYTALTVIERRHEMEAAVAALQPSDLIRLIRAVADQRREIREFLFEAGSALSPDLYVKALAASQRVTKLARTERLLDYAITSPKKYDLESEGGRRMRAVVARDFVETLVVAAETYLNL